MNINYENLESSNKAFFDQIRNDTSVKRFIHVADTYYDYLLSTKNVMYKLIKVNQNVVGGLHIEFIDNYATFSIEIMGQYQNRGIARQVVNELKKNTFNFRIKMYKVFVEISNEYSNKLFTSCGFIRRNEEDGIIEFVHKL